MAATAVAPSTPTIPDDIDAEIVAIVARAQAGDQAAFGLLYDRYVTEVFGFVHSKVRHRQTAEDLTSDVFLRACRSIHRFEWQGKSIRAWLFTIARNICHDHWKSAQTRLSTAVEETPESATPGVDAPERIAEGRALARTLGQALERLNEQHRAIIELRFVHGMTTQETAEVLGRSYAATKQLQFRALKALQKECATVPGLAEFAAAGLGALVWLIRVGL